MSWLDWNSIENSRHGITCSVKVPCKFIPSLSNKFKEIRPPFHHVKNSDSLSQISYEMSPMEDIFKMQQMYGLKKEEQEIQEQLRKMGYID